ncbi:Putative fluoride ion transporter CrcB [Linum grandiflorum]
MAEAGKGSVEERSGSFGKTSSVGSSLRRRSCSLSRTLSFQTEHGIEGDNVSEAGDIGDRALHSNRHSESGSVRRLSLDLALESGVAYPIPEDDLSRWQWSHLKDHRGLDAKTHASPLTEEDIAPRSTEPMIAFKEEKDNTWRLPPLFEYISCLLYLAVFGILGVLTRYLLQKLFGPSIARLTSDSSPLYLDLPSNMVGSFLMGWLGVIFKARISMVSDHLAIGLSTGYLGSLTTFSGWNQKMLDLVVDGEWVSAISGFLLGNAPSNDILLKPSLLSTCFYAYVYCYSVFAGLFLAAYSIKFGVGTAKCFQQLLQTLNCGQSSSKWTVNTFRRHLTVMTVLVLMLGLLWTLSGTLLRKEFNDSSTEAQLWIACIAAAPGVWIRWFLARLNGRGLGKSGALQWVPFGTLIANISAACIMAALATVKNKVDSKDCDTIATGIQFGFLGCLSTVSTFMAEYNAMEESTKPWRAYVYGLVTILASFTLGILIYAVPLWSK